MSTKDQAYHGWQPERVNFLFGMSGRRTALHAREGRRDVWLDVRGGVQIAVRPPSTASFAP